MPTYTDPLLQLRLGDAPHPHLERVWSRRFPVFTLRTARENERAIAQLLPEDHAAELRPDGPDPATVVLATGDLRPLAGIDPLALSGPLRLRIAAALAEALQQVHACEVFHLSLRPSVVLVSPDLRQARIIDFSSSRVCRRPRSGVGAFRPLLADDHFLAPEQLHISSDIVDNRTDLYALGGLFLWLLTGRPPFPDIDGSEELA